MIVPVQFTPDNSTLIPNIVWEEQRRYSQPTSSNPIPIRREEKFLTERIKTENEDEEVTATQVLEQSKVSFDFQGRYSQEYTSYNTQELISTLIEEFSNWKNLGTDEALIHISKIKTLTLDYENYFYQDSKHRILLGMLQLIFNNNRWETITAGQINQVLAELNRFKDGNVDWESLEKFSKQLYVAKVSSLKSNEDEKEEAS